MGIEQSEKKQTDWQKWVRQLFVSLGQIKEEPKVGSSDVASDAIQKIRQTMADIEAGRTDGRE